MGNRRTFSRDLTPEWHEERRKTLGGSDLPVLLGMSRFATVVDLWKDKLGIPRERSTFADEYSEWGRRLEPVIVQKYRESHPDHTVVDNRKKHVKAMYSCTPDGLVIAPDGLEFGLETKNRGYTTKRAWSNGVEVSVAIQCHWSMMVTGWPRWDVAVLIGGNTYREYTLEENPELQKRLIVVADDFWMDVGTETEPDPARYEEARMWALEALST